MSELYDLAIPLGEACSSTETLREAGLQYLSFPYDWLANAEVDTERAIHDLVTRATQVAERFDGWFDAADFKFVASTPANKKDVFINTKLGLIFNHDFPMGMEFSEAFKLVHNRFRKRIRRFLSLLDGAKRVLIFRLERPADKILKPMPTSLDDCREARRILSEAYPHAKFDVILFAFERGRDEKDMIIEEIEPGLKRITFDYHNYAPGFLEYAVRVDKTAEIVKRYASVVDYRTDEEKAAYRKLRLKKRLNKFLKPFKRIFNRR